MSELRQIEFGEVASTAVASGCRVVLLSGGASGEREVSLATGRGVRAALEQPPAESATLRVSEVRAVEIERDGRWLVGGEALDAPRAIERLGEVDVFFLCLHGGAGEDGTVQGLLASAGRRHTGSGVRASALCMDKLALRGLAREHGLRVAPGAYVDAGRWREQRLVERARLVSISRSGWVVKPRCGGSSVDTGVVHDLAGLEGAIERVLASGDDALVEARVVGVELSCGVLEDEQGELRALTPIEIQPRDGRFFDYEQKYSAEGAREVCPPVSVDARTLGRVRSLAARIHRLAGCSGYSRADFIVPRLGPGFGEPVLLEVNTLPGLTERSLLPQEAAVDGIDYAQLCLRILSAATRSPR